ncbi:dihydrolipoyllysine-residue acetyltransferase [Deinococcus radiophilus]|uniref:Acetyltransferase component of pyruvate dehydrogenase complex n=1 Tax=Deinococcus radiophilus TaxID=32062 RepID=A0A3S0IT47_9DEIO|nr:dihydrolipoyllysine-residue acetyltransferase [Deinococcus radiophilus]RTR30852.1 dihydrolipoyllysine-residue acetyltransferase [Deinococcus radiophilus]UFA49433.1 dihydrolipoyllysine-residue acetyltransferase [Deinococcus radiophilus]
MTELKLPEVGDNITEGTVVSVNVRSGDTVAEGDTIIEIETDKAVVEVPATAGGTVGEIKVAVGDKVPVGGVILILTDGGGVATPAQASSAPVSAQGGGDQAMQQESTAVSPSDAQANTVAAEQQQAQKAEAGAAQSGNTSSAPVSGSPVSGGGQTVVLPDVGDNIEQGTVVTVLVAEGDTVSEGDPIIEIETDKAVVEVPSSASGTVQSISVKVGDKVTVGGTILTLGGGTRAAAPASGTPAPAQGGGDQAASQESSAGASNAVAAEQQQAQKAGAAQGQSAAQAAAPAQSGTQNPKTYEGRDLHPAAPSVRRLAREMGVELNSVQGTGIAGRISEEDVRRAAGTPSVTGAPAAQAASAPTAAAAPATQPLPDFAKWGNVTREDMNGIRKATVRSMTASWTTIPMVTHFDKADVTVMEETRKRFGERVAKAGGKLTMTHILMKVVANALRQFPKFGASLDLQNEQVIFKDFVNIGVAVDTPVGLLVPVVKDADRKTITELVLELTDLAERARERKLKPDEMQGATFTISNLGGIGGHAFTPIVNSPEVAILGVSRGGMEPVWNKEKGEFEPRNMLPLSLTYDHRLIDGADAARFLRFIAESLEDPFLISL